jgi:hypothetical protein
MTEEKFTVAGEIDRLVTELKPCAEGRWILIEGQNGILGGKYRSPD